MKFLGVDPSLTGSGLAVIDESYNIITLDKFSTPTTGVERLYHLELKLLEFLENNSNINFVCIEGGAYRETGRIFDLGQWAGILYLTLYKLSIPYISVAPLQLKKYVSLVGKNVGKGVVILDVFKNFGEEIRDDDKADAYVLSRIAHDYYMTYTCNKDVELVKARKDVLKKLYKVNNPIDEKSLLSAP